MAKLAIFDFDGTIVNTITDVALSFNEALEKHGFPSHPLEAFDGFVGGNLETVVSRMLPKEAINNENVDAVKLTYREIYSNSPKENTLPYDGVMKLLTDMKDDGWKLAINSNKGQKLVDDLAIELFPEGMFDSIVGYLESRPSKPDSYGVNMICQECGVDISEAIYVGDGMSDVLTAVNAGIPCIFTEWGQGTLDGDYPNVVSVANIQELRKCLYK